jgi:hypothetical protein
MKKILLVTGIVVALIIIGVLSYLVFFTNGSESGDQFSDLNFGDTTDGSAPLSPPVEEAPEEPAAPSVLTQITDTPVLGFAEVGTSSEAKVIYVAAGTGHVFQYDPVTMNTTRISNITIQDARNAVVSDDGAYVVVEAGPFVTSELAILTLPQGTSSDVSIFRLEQRAENVAIVEPNRLVFTVEENGTTVGRQFSLESLAFLGNLFTIPFGEAALSWGSAAEGSHFVYPKPSEQLRGSVYRIENGQLDRLPLSSYGLSVVGNNSNVIIDNNEERNSIFYNTFDAFIFTTDDYILPEKCTFNRELDQLVVCAQNQDFLSPADVTNWRKGQLTTHDTILLYDLNDLNETVINLDEYTSKEFDVDKLYFSQNVLFRHRVDETLWLINLLAIDN